MAAFVVSKLVGLLRERAIAHQFGAGQEYDAYVAAFNIPDLLFTLIAGGALVSAFLPVFSDALVRGNRKEAWRLASAVTNIVFLATLILAALAAAFAPWLVEVVIAPGFSTAQQALTVDLMRIVLLSTLLFAISGIQMGILNAFQHFLLPAVAPIFYNLGILFGAIWLAPRYGIRGLAFGVVLGAALHLLVKVPGLIHFGFRYYPTLGVGMAGVRQVGALMVPRVLALATVKAVFLVNVRLASGLVGGSLSAFNYAWVISQMPQTILGTAIGTVAFPTLAEMAALDRRQEFRSTVIGTLRVMIAVTVPAAVAMWTLSGPAIGVLLQTGEFDDRAAAATQSALQMFSLGLLGHVMLEVVARAYYSRKDTVTPMIGAAAAMVANIVLAVILVGPMAHSGLALANSIAVSAEVVLLLLWLGPRIGGVWHDGLASTSLRAAVAGAAMAIAVVASLALTDAVLPGAVAGYPVVIGGVQLVFGGLVGVAAYVATAALAGMEEIGILWQIIRSRLARRSTGGGA
jgi:putative peptidoglycan lipid II flippase